MVSRGVFLDSETLDYQDVDFSPLLETLSHWDLYPLTSPEEVAERIQDATLVITNKVPISAQVLQTAPTLQWIGSAATGFDQIDIDAATQCGVVVSNVGAYSTVSVVQHTIGLIINSYGRLADYHTLVQQGDWQKSPLFCLQDYLTQELAGKTLGIVGYGAIGQGVAQVAKALGMEVRICKRESEGYALETWLKDIDILSLHCRLTSQTRQLINADTLSYMKPSALLINTARGGLVDEAALANALRQGQLGAAALDVLVEEPPRRGSPLLSDDLPTLFITPHIAWSTREARQRLLTGLVANVRAFLAGAPQNVVN